MFPLFTQFRRFAYAGLLGLLAHSSKGTFPTQGSLRDWPQSSGFICYLKPIHFAIGYSQTSKQGATGALQENNHHDRYRYCDTANDLSKHNHNPKRFRGHFWRFYRYSC